MAVCLPKFAADEFKKRLKNGDINPGKLSGMTSEQRRAFFSEFMGDANAKTTNALFESKLLLKDQQRGMITWAKQLTGIKPEVRRDILAKVERLDRVLEPEELDMFLQDLVEQRLGLGVSAKEASEIAGLAKDIAAKKEAMGVQEVDSYLRQLGRPKTPEELAFGEARVKFANYTNDLKVDAEKMTLADLKANPGQTVGRTISNLGGQAKSITASMDNSSIFNQGWKTLFTNPIIWQKHARNTFVDMAKTLGGKNVMDAMNAEIVSRPTYDLMKKAGLSIGTIEEAFPSALPEKIPGFGRVYKASQDAYTGFVHRTRADVFDKMLQVAQKSGVDITDKEQLQAIGKLVNSLTGRGNLGKLEPVANVANNLLFSPRFLKSNIDMLTLHATDKNFTPFARKQAAQNLLKVVTGTAAVLGIASQIGKAFGYDDIVEWDPRSADFGKIKIGDTRFGIGGGMPGIVTLVSRLMPTQNKKGEWNFYTKSTTSKSLKPLDGSAYGSDNALDVLVNFFLNKASPAAGVVRDVYKGKNFDGEKVTPANAALGLITPFPVKTAIELEKNPNSAPDLLSLIISGLGVSVNDYGPPKK